MKAITHYKDRIGQKFGRMTIIDYEPINHRGRYVCQCEFETRHWNSKNPFERDNVYELTKAPQSFCFIEV